MGVLGDLIFGTDASVKTVEDARTWTELTFLIREARVKLSEEDSKLLSPWWQYECDLYNFVTELNDSRQLSFEKIAEYLEKYRDQLFPKPSNDSA